jgi:hypothetical protein
MGPKCHAVYDAQAETEFNSQASIMFSMRYKHFSAITGTRKPISHQLGGCKKAETAQANLAM